MTGRQLLAISLGLYAGSALVAVLGGSKWVPVLLARDVSVVIGLFAVAELTNPKAQLRRRTIPARSPFSTNGRTSH